MDHPLNQQLQERVQNDDRFRHNYGGLLRACQEAMQKVKATQETDEPTEPEETGKLPEAACEEAFSLPRFEGSALYPCVALSNHSCVPNFTMRYRDGALADMVALRDIQVGDELNLAYVSPSLPLPERVGSLWKTWGFVCTCRRCQDDIMIRAVTEGKPGKTETGYPTELAGLQLSPAGIAAAMAVRRDDHQDVEATEDTSDCSEASFSSESESVDSDLGDTGVATARNAPFSGPFGASQIPESVTKIEAAMRDLMEEMGPRDVFE